MNDGRLEKDVASVEVAKGDGSSLTFGPFPFKTDAEAVDLVLRANPALGGATIDLFEAWKGEIVFEDQALNRPTSRVGAK